MSTAVDRPRESWHGVEMSVEEFLALPEDGVHRELIKGRVREERDLVPLEQRGQSVTVRNRFHSRIEARICYFLVDWLEKQPAPRGDVVCGEAGFRLRSTEDSLVGIDAALVSAELVAATKPTQKIFDGPPTLAVEILSANDTHEDIVDGHFLSRGGQRGLGRGPGFRDGDCPPAWPGLADLSYGTRAFRRTVPARLSCQCSQAICITGDSSTSYLAGERGRHFEPERTGVVGASVSLAR